VQLPGLGGHVQARGRGAVCVGARLDEKPELLFVLRNVDEKELLAGAGRDLAITQGKPGGKVLDDGDVAALFGLEMAETPAAEMPVSVAPMGAKRSKPPAVKTAAAAKKKAAEKKGAKRAEGPPPKGTTGTTVTKHLGAGGKIAVPLASAPAKRRAS
jgi:hypothetical protein